MAGLEQQPNQQRIFLRRGGTVRVVLEGGTILDVKNPTQTSYTIEHRTPSPREAQREKLKAKFEDVLFPHVQARLTQHGLQVVGGEEISGEMTLIETGQALKDWMEQAKEVGISNQEILTETRNLLRLVTIGAPKMGEASSLAKGINTEIAILVDEVWGKRARRRGGLR